MHYGSMKVIPIAANPSPSYLEMNRREHIETSNVPVGTFRHHHHPLFSRPAIMYLSIL